MKVLVPVTQVGTVDDEFVIDGVGIDERYLSYDFNEWDDYAVEEAIRCKESRDDVEVVTVTIGPERTEETIRRAIAKGADRAVRVWDDALADASVHDPTTKAEILAAVARTEDPDLVFAGVQSADDAFGATGVAMAAALGFEWAAVVNDLVVDVDAGTAAVRRELEGGLEELTEVDLPAVFTVQAGINEPRYASLPGIRRSQDKPLDVLELDDLGLSAGDLPLALTLTDCYEPETEAETTLLEGSADETAGELAGLLRDEGVGV